MHSTRGRNYLSVPFQLSIIDTFFDQIKFDLLNKLYISGTFETINFHCILTASIQSATNHFKNVITTPLEESKDETPANNNILLLAYFKNIEDLFLTTSRTLATDYFNDAITICKNFSAFINHAVDISIYKVELSKKQYFDLFKASSFFHYDGKWNAAKKIVGGGFMLSFAAFESPASRSSMFKNGKDALNQGFSRIGYTCQMPISSEWIKGTVNKDGTLNLHNPHFSNHDSDPQVIYVLDANDPEKVFMEGVTYTNKAFNPLGNLVFFHELRDAAQCGRQRSDGLLYDLDNGWRRYHAWTDEERAQNVQTIKSTIASTTPLIPVITEIVGEYLDIPSSMTSSPGKR